MSNPQDHVSVSVVVATRDRAAMLEDTIASLRAHLRPTDEFIVVDSASRDPRVGEVAQRSGGHVITLDRAGTSRARNAGLSIARAPVVAFIDDDCLVGAGWSTRVEEAFSDTAVGFVTGRALADRHVRVPTAVVVEETARRFEGPVDPSAYGGGANMAFRREALLGIGGFDEGLGPGTPLRAAEDHDAFWRLSRAGWVGVYDPSIVVTHRQWRSDARAALRKFSYGIGAGALAVKTIRLGDRSGWGLLRRRFWGDGLLRGVRSLLKGHEGDGLASLVRAVGVLVGAIRAWIRPLTDDRYGR